ncbi:hypothetical protein BBJ28_00006315 [Nothophytophthora sp. Chile5]|nr:hypothetical protein BBJ28_00006315 [Nothophytophthora sp. Chile5]
MQDLPSPKTPKADYVPVLDGGNPPLSTSRLNNQPSLPMLAAGGRATSQDMLQWEPSSARSARSGDYEAASDVQSGPRRPRTPYLYLPSPVQRLLRAWMVLRWRLSRSVFSVTIPYLTANVDLKLGDLIVTLPILAIVTAVTAIQAKDRDVAGTGTLPTLAMLFVFGFAVRNNSVLLVLTGIPFERALFYHKAAAFATIILSALHGLAYVLARHNDEEGDQQSRALTGIVAFGAMVLMFVLSLNVIRRKFFEFFVRVHWILFLVVLVFAVIHGAGLALVGVVPWAIDMLFRLVYRTRIYSQGSLLKPKTTDDSASSSSPSNVLSNKRMGVIARDQLLISKLPGDIMRVSFPRIRKDTGEVFEYEAGQYAFLCIPAISNLQWHPFTISSSPHEAMVTFHIKVLGDWTNALMELAGEIDGTSSARGSPSPFDILVDGPYGSVSVDIEDPSTYSHFALFSGGIGVTPMRSIVNWLHHEHRSEGRTELKRVNFAWSVRDRELIEALVSGETWKVGERRADAYFPHELLTSTNSAGGVFSTEFYLTRSERDIEAAPVDQQLESCLRYGSRPDVAAILHSVGEQAKQDGKERVAVLVCGPAAMVKDVVTMSSALSREMKIRFDVHSELFEF